jgi:GTP-binding protein
MRPAIVIVGRPNVGKSTLFNRLAGRKAAIVHDTPGVTRDRQEVEVRRGGLDFCLVDTAGFDADGPNVLAQNMTEQTLAAIGSADLCLFVIDARAGVTADDERLAKAIRRAGKPAILLANKSEGRTVDISDASRWGFGEPIAVSSAHGTGMDELFDALVPYAAEDTNEEPEESHPLRLAIVGRPNVGKSTLFNALLGEERVLTGAEAGTTRDAIAAPLTVKGRAVLLYDTAGLRKRARAAGQPLERLAVESALSAIRFAECVIVLLDAMQAFEKQDLAIADLVVREGRAAIFAVNKWDCVERKAGAITVLSRERDRLLPQIAGAPLVAISARTGEGLARLLPAVFAAGRAWNSRIPTAELNRFLAPALERHPPPAIRGRRIRIRYMTQAKTRPPTFALFGTQLKELPESWLRYLANELRARFDLAGAPIRLLLRTAKNPYSSK